MKASYVMCYNLINGTDAGRVAELVESLLANGWVGCPILTYGESLLTGSHRCAALRALSEIDFDDPRFDRAQEILDMDVSEDVTDIMEQRAQELEEELGYIPDLEYDNLSMWLQGSWVEEYKDEIVEW